MATPDAKSPPATTTTPVPRFRWLKRGLLTAAALLVLLVGLRLYWGQAMQARVDRVVADIHDRGEPILFSDLQYTPLADDENGAWHLMRALNNWPAAPGTGGLRIDETDWYLEGEAAGYTDPITDNAAYLDTCRGVLDDLRRADRADHAAWGTPPTRPLFNSWGNHFGDMRRLAYLLDDAGRRALDAGDTDLVFETMLLQHAITRHVHPQHVQIIDSLIAIQIMAINRDFIEYALPRIDPVALREGPARDKAEQVITQLTGDMLRDGFIQGFIGERAMSYDIYESLMDGTTTVANMFGSAPPTEWLIETPGLNDLYRPVLRNAQYRSTVFYTDAIETLRNKKTYTDIGELSSDLEQHATANPVLYPLVGMLLPAYSAANRTFHRSQTLLHCAAVAIAIKLYEADHGQRPDTLDQLVPGYLPAIPVDPFSPTGEPIRYNPAGVVPTVLDDYNQLTEAQRNQLALRPYPVLYSVGEDGTDHNGGPLYLNPTGELADNERYSSPEDGETGDIWFMLDAWPEAVFEDSELGGDPYPAPFPQ